MDLFYLRKDRKTAPNAFAHLKILLIFTLCLMFCMYHGKLPNRIFFFLKQTQQTKKKQGTLCTIPHNKYNTQQTTTKTEQSNEHSWILNAQSVPCCMVCMVQYMIGSWEQVMVTNNKRQQLPKVNKLIGKARQGNPIVDDGWFHHHIELLISFHSFLSSPHPPTSLSSQKERTSQVTIVI